MRPLIKAGHTPAQLLAHPGIGCLQGSVLPRSRPKGDEISVKVGHCFTGVRSPPLRRVSVPGEDGLAGKAPQTTRWVIFSEGRGLRARIVRPCLSQGIT